MVVRAVGGMVVMTAVVTALRGLFLSGGSQSLFRLMALMLLAGASACFTLLTLCLFDLFDVPLVKYRSAHKYHRQKQRHRNCKRDPQRDTRSRTVDENKRHCDNRKDSCVEEHPSKRIHPVVYQAERTARRINRKRHKPHQIIIRFAFDITYKTAYKKCVSYKEYKC